MTTIAGTIAADWRQGLRILCKTGDGDALYNSALQRGIGETNVAAILGAGQGREVLARQHSDGSITLYTDDGFDCERMWAAQDGERTIVANALR